MGGVTPRVGPSVGVAMHGAGPSLGVIVNWTGLWWVVMYGAGLLVVVVTDGHGHPWCGRARVGVGHG